MGHVLLAGEGEAFGQGGGEPAELEGAQGDGEVGAERVGQRDMAWSFAVTGGWARAGAGRAAAPARGMGLGLAAGGGRAGLAGRRGGPRGRCRGCCRWRWRC